MIESFCTCGPAIAHEKEQKKTEFQQGQESKSILRKGEWASFTPQDK